ncbi:MAG: insulinase family protein [Kiritimatiellae bacterium]|nr:insulinase family protein [Kiritimatiellia bacterium]
MLDTLNVTELANGIKIVTLEQPHAESAQIAIHVRVGSRNETEAQNGASHFIEHMLFKGTAKRSAKAISQAIEGQGGSINAFTDKDNTCYYVKVPYDRAFFALNVLADLFYNSTFDEKELNRERQVIAEEIYMYDDQPDSLALENLNGQLWSGHPLGRPILGTLQSLSGLTRDALLHYRTTQYAPCRTVFSFAGKIQHDACVKAVEKLAGHLTNPPLLREPETFSRAIPQEPLTLTKRDIQQTQLAFGWRTPGLMESKALAVASVLSCALGESMMSRLFQSIRERKGLCYSITSGRTLAVDCGALLVTAGCESRKAGQCTRAILAEVRKLMEKPMSAAELRRTRDYLCGRFRLRMDGAPIGWAAGRILFGVSADPEAVLEGIRAVTAEEVRAFATEILTPERLSLAIVAPKKDATSETAWLKLRNY